MANLYSSLDEILTELGDYYDADIAPRRIVRSTSNKIWIQLRAFSRGLFDINQTAISLKYRFDPIYCSDDDLESTMRMVGTTRNSGTVTLLTVTVWNTNTTNSMEFVGGSSGTPDGGYTRYLYTSANGVSFALDLYESVMIPANSFMTFDFYSIQGDTPYIGAFSVSDNSNITVTRADQVEIPADFTFDCADNAGQLGYPEETMFEVRQRILTDNRRQEILHILEERLKALPNIHECTIIYNNTLTPQPVDYYNDNGLQVSVVPQSIFVVLTGSPTQEFAEVFLSLCPFTTQKTPDIAAADSWVVNYPSASYINGVFPIYYVKHIIATFDVTVKYGYNALGVDTLTVEDNLRPLLRPFQASTQYQEIVKIEDYFIALAEYRNPNVRILDIHFTYNGQNVTYIEFKKTQIARLANIGFTPVPLWS